jgi:hypothetical protein
MAKKLVETALWLAFKIALIFFLIEIVVLLKGSYGY